MDVSLHRPLPDWLLFGAPRAPATNRPILAIALLAAASAALLSPQASHAQAQDDRMVVLETAAGSIVIELFPDDAPNHVDNFAELAGSGFYDGTIFHRIIPGFMIQGGDPNTRADSGVGPGRWGTGGPDHEVAAEFNTIAHERGIVSMARSAHVDSAGSQFFIVHRDSSFLDGQYTAFGRVATAGSLEALDAIAALPVMVSDVPEDRGAAEISRAYVTDRASLPGEDLLDLGEPARTGDGDGDGPALSTSPLAAESGSYSSEEFGIAFEIPEGWLVQERPEPEPGTPDVVALGPRGDAGGPPPAVSVIVEPRNGTALPDKVAENAVRLGELADAGLLEVLSSEGEERGGIQAYRTDARSHFPVAGQNVSVLFREIVLEGGENFYTLTYSSPEDSFEDGLYNFEAVLSSFEMPDEPPRPGPQGGGCLVATAAYGSELAPQVQALREVRDGLAASAPAGASLVAGFNAAYYAFSPAVADMQRESPAFGAAVRLAIAPLVWALSAAAGGPGD